MTGRTLETAEQKEARLWKITDGTMTFLMTHTPNTLNTNALDYALSQCDLVIAEADPDSDALKVACYIKSVVYLFKGDIIQAGKYSIASGITILAEAVENER